LNKKVDLLKKTMDSFPADICPFQHTADARAQSWEWICCQERQRITELLRHGKSHMQGVEFTVCQLDHYQWSLAGRGYSENARIAGRNIIKELRERFMGQRFLRKAYGSGVLLDQWKTVESTDDGNGLYRIEFW
jgi:hypothetical protein